MTNKKNTITVRIKPEDYSYLEEEAKKIEKIIGYRPHNSYVLKKIIEERKRMKSEFKRTKSEWTKSEWNYFDI